MAERQAPAIGEAVRCAGRVSSPRLQDPHEVDLARGSDQTVCTAALSAGMPGSCIDARGQPRASCSSSLQSTMPDRRRAGVGTRAAAASQAHTGGRS